MIVYDDVRNVHGDCLAEGHNMVIDGVTRRVTLGWELPSGNMEPKISFETDAEAEDFIREMRRYSANEIICGIPRTVNMK